MEMEINDLQKYNLAQEMATSYDADELIRTLNTIPKPLGVKLICKKIEFQTNEPYSPIPHKVALIDFEGSPAILMGILIHDTILTYYIEDYRHLNEFHLTLLKIFSVIRDLTIFEFSSYEHQELIRIHTSLSEQGYNLSDYEFIKTLPIINLQKDKFESVAEAVFSTNPKIRFTGDPLFRNIKVIDKLFLTGRIDEIITHNRTCLLNERIILERWVRHYNISRINSKR
jgi:hypothetical protein